MTDPLYADRRLAAVYDAFEEPRDDLDAYVGIAAELAAHRIVDLGCGTGCLALRLADAGHTVVGIDPAAASVDVARAKAGAERVDWIVGDAADIPTHPPADLVVMTGNAAQGVLTDDAWYALLRHTYAALRPGGHLVLESRRPEGRAWEDWSTEPVAVVTESGERVQRRLAVTAVDLPLVSFRWTHLFADGTTVASDSTIRFRSGAELTTDLSAAGFTSIEIREAPDRPGRELVVLAGRG